MPREGITLRCEKCKEQNYISKKNKRTSTEKIELLKFCSRCNARTSHKEMK